MPDDKKIKRYGEIKKEMEKLKEEADKIEAEFLKAMETDLEDTKYKSVTYTDESGNTAVATMADSVKLIYPSYLKKIFGEAYGDVITETVTYKLSDAAKRLLAALYKKEFVRDSSIDELVGGLRLDNKTAKALLKKLKGNKFDTDVKNIIKLTGMDEESAKENAYLASEITAWDNLMKLLELNYEKIDDNVITTVLKWIDGAVVVEETPKITFNVQE